MLIKNTKIVYIYEPIPSNNFGEVDNDWKYKKNIKSKDGTYILNIQQNINELDINSSGKVDYEIRKAVTRQDYNINKGDGISFKDISSLEKIKPELIVKEKVTVGNSTVYILEKNND